MIDWDSCVLWLDSKYFSESYWWDKSRYCNNGVVHGARWEAYSFYFDGNDDYINCGNNESFDITDAITIVASIKLMQLDPIGGSGQHIIRKDEVYAFGIGTGGKIGFWLHDNNGWHGSWTFSNNSINTEQHVLAGRWNGNVMEVFIDGKKDSNSLNLDTTLTVNEEDVYLGNFIAANEALKGYITYLTLFKIGLSDSEIKILSDLIYRR